MALLRWRVLLLHTVKIVKWVWRTEGQRDGNRGNCASLPLRSQLKTTSILYMVVTYCTGRYEVFLKNKNDKIKANTLCVERRDIWVWRCKWCAEIHMKREVERPEEGRGEKKRSSEAGRWDCALAFLPPKSVEVESEADCLKQDDEKSPLWCLLVAVQSILQRKANVAAKPRQPCEQGPQRLYTRSSPNPPSTGWHQLLHRPPRCCTVLTE